MHCLCHDDDEGDDNEVFADVGMAERDLESPALPWAGPINQHAIPLSLKIPLLLKIPLSLKKLLYFFHITLPICLFWAMCAIFSDFRTYWASWAILSYTCTYCNQGHSQHFRMICGRP